MNSKEKVITRLAEVMVCGEGVEGVKVITINK